MNVDLRPMGMEDLSRYDALFLGRLIRFCQCTPGIKRFLKKNLTALTCMQVAFFKGCLNVEKLTPIHRLIMWVAMVSLPEITNGDFLNPVIIESWTKSLFSRMKMPEERV